MSARRIDYAQVRTGGHTGPPLRWELPPRRAVHPKRSRPSLRNEKKLRFLLAYELRKQIEVTAFDEWNCRADVACVGADLRVRPQNRLRSGEDGRTHRSAPTKMGVTASDGWICRVDVVCVGADLRVRPYGIKRPNEDRRTHKSAPTVGAPTPLSGSPEEKSTELPKREKTSHFTCI